MRHKTTARFCNHFHALPVPVQEIARKNYQILSENPRHPSLRFKKVGNDSRSRGVTLDISIIPMIAIGTIRTPYKTKQECPIQPFFASANTARVEVFEQYAEGLKDVETFSHLYLLYEFDRADEIRLVRSTFLDDTPHGIFASRHPCRPSPIGMSIVKLVARSGNVLVVEGADMLDDTPLLDIKPYLPQYDAILSASEGWTANKPWRQKPEGRE